MIIGISGKIGSGKDTVAGIIIDNKPKYTRKAFGDKLKKAVALLTGAPENLMYTQEGKEVYLSGWDMTVGQFQQKLGTEAMRDVIHKDGWVLALMSDYIEDYNWIISDVRFKNEAEAIREKGGLLIRVNGDPAKVRANSTRDMTHQSEVDLDDWEDWDAVIENNGTLLELQNKIKKLINDLRI